MGEYPQCPPRGGGGAGRAGPGPLCTARLLLACLLAGAGLAGPGEAQDAAPDARSWRVHEADSACWVLAAPESVENLRPDAEGVLQPAEVQRGEIRFFVYSTPGTGMRVAYTGGYPFDTGDPIVVQIGDSPFNLYSRADDPATERLEDEFAWPEPGRDGAIIAAMRRNASMLVTALSSRGTTTRDRFSLDGFRAALDEARRRCGG